MINEAVIIPYTQDWKNTKLNKQNNNYNIQNEFELSLYYHLESIINDGGNLEEEINKLIKKYPNQNIDKQYLINKFNTNIFE